MFFEVRGRANPTKATVSFGEAAAFSWRRRQDRPRGPRSTQRQDGTWQAQTSHGEFSSNNAGPCTGSLVQAAGRPAGHQDPCRPCQRPDVGHRPGTAEYFPADRVRGIPLRMELRPRVDHVASGDGIGHTAARRRFPPKLTHLGDLRVTRHLYGGQTRNGEIIFGGDRQLVGYNYNPDGNGIEVNRGYASEVIPLLRGYPSAAPGLGSCHVPWMENR